jgi:hypothetical protein
MTNIISLDDTPSVPTPAQVMAPRPEAPLGVAPRPVAPSWASTFGSSFARENTVANVMSFGEGPARLADQDIPEDWNPVAFARSSWDKERFDKLRPFVSDGVFNYATNPSEVEWIANRIETRLAESATISAGPTSAAILGGLSGSILDLPSLLPPVRFLRGTTALSRGFNLAASVAGQQAVQEGALQSMDPTRTWAESLMNVGTGFALGGALGAFTRVGDIGMPLHPRDPNNPLRPENIEKQGMAFRILGSEGEDIHGVDGNLSAAYAGPSLTDAEKAVRFKSGPFRWLANKIESVSPIGRALQSDIREHLDVVRQMVDFGGIFSRGNLLGRATNARTAEDLKIDYLRGRESAFEFGEQTFNRMNAELGEQGIKKASVTLFQEVARKQLIGIFNDSDRARLTDLFGETAVPIIERRAGEYVGALQDLNTQFEAALVRIGRLQDTARLDALEKELEPLLAERDALKRDGADPERLKEVRSEIDRVRGELLKESSKPEPLGKEYGHAILWDGAAMQIHREKARDFLYKVLLDNPADEFLQEGYGLTAKQFERLGSEPVTLKDFKWETSPDGVRTQVQTETVISPEEGAAMRRRIMRDWGGEEFQFKMDALARARDAAAKELKQAKLDYFDLARAYGWTAKDADAYNLREAKAYRDLAAAELDQARAARNRAAVEYEAITTAAEAARRRTLDRQLQYVPEKPDVGETQLERFFGAAERLRATERRLSEFDGNRGFLDLQGTQRDPELTLRLEAYLTAARRYEDASRAAALDPLVAPKVPEVEASVAYARLEGRAQALERQLTAADARLAKADEKTRALYAKWSELESKSKLYKHAKAELKTARSEAKVAVRAAEKTANAVDRATTRLAKRGPVAEYVEKLIDTLGNKGRIPGGIDDDVLQTTGRVKERRFKLTPEQRREAEELGLLRTDLSGILYHQYNSLAGYIALHEALGIGIPGAARFASWADVVRHVQEGFTRNIEELSSAGKVKEAAVLRDKMRSATEDLGLLKDRLLGTVDPGLEPDSWLAWTSRKVRQANYIRYGAGFGANSLTDLAGFSLQHGIWPLFSKMLPEVIRIGRGMSNSELRAIVNAHELSQGGLLLARVFDEERPFKQYGIGSQGTTKQAVTSRIDAGMERLSDTVYKWSGLRHWNRYMKIAAGVMRAYAIRDAVGRYDGLSQIKKAELASLGIGEAEAKAIREQIQLHAKQDGDTWDPNLSAWGDQAAARDFRIAIRRDMDRSVITPGIGDTPGLMSKWYGQLLLQFQSFAFGFLNRFMTPTAQRISLMQDPRALVAYGHLAWTGFVVLVFKDLVNGRDPAERFTAEKLPQTMVEVADRAGITSYLSPYIDSALKATAPLQEAAFGSSLKPTSRFARNAWWESLLGPSFGTARDAAQFTSAAIAGDSDQVIKKGLLLAPFNTYLRLTHNLFN